MVVMDPDGAVRAMVGGRDYGESQFNRATDGAAPARLVLQALRLRGGALDRPLPPEPSVTDTAGLHRQLVPAATTAAAPMPARCRSTTALAKSINTIPVKMSIDIGRATGDRRMWRAPPRSAARRSSRPRRAMGLTTPLTDTVSLPIGAAEVTVIDMTAAYAVFANGGRRAKPYAAVEVRNSHGEVIYRRDRDEPPRRRRSWRRRSSPT